MSTTQLIEQIVNDNDQELSSLCQRALDLESMRHNNESLIHFAVHQDKPKCLKVILDNWNSDVDVLNEDGSSALHICVMRNQVDIS